ncbi:MAG: AzlC family ABC transporter permease [Treponema sp.]|jgi:4-azaleucine resistance transporter AzlC|nr:AzlC family ABC transporter permease [Treponema sp.]
MHEYQHDNTVGKETFCPGHEKVASPSWFGAVEDCVGLTVMRKNSNAVFCSRAKIFTRAFRVSIPVLLGFFALGAAYGLLLVNSGYSWWLAPLSGILIYAGSGQFLAVGLFASGAALGEIVAAELALNARHIAYGISLFKRINNSGCYKWYLVYALADETFALISNLDDDKGVKESSLSDRNLLMFFIAILDQCYWIVGSVIGAVVGSFIPFNFEGIGFSLTALFIVLMCEQILKVKKAVPFLVSAAVAVLAVVFLPSRFALFASLMAAIMLTHASSGRALSDAVSGEAE